MQEKITSITWMNSGKIKAIDMNTTATGNKKDLQYDYDAMGNRVAKHVFSAAGVYEYSLYYIRDAQGNVISTYKKLMNVSNVTTSLKQTERHLYGSSRLGTDIAEIEMIGATSNTSGIFNHFLGQKVFESSNHLGNVLTTFTDKKVPRTNLSSSTKIDFWMPELYSATDYYPFGQAMPGRNFELTNASKYRYGFNGKENDNEVKGQGNQQDYGMRIYDPRLGKFLSVDPLTRDYPWNSTYAFAENSPISGIDLEGAEFFYAANGDLIGKIGNSTEIRVIDESKVKMGVAVAIIRVANAFNASSASAAPHLDKFSVSLTDYATNVTDVLNDASLESWADNGQNCYTAAMAQMSDAGIEVQGKTNAIQTNVDNSKQPKAEQLLENKAGGLIYTITELKKGNPVMVGVKEKDYNGNVANVGNYNKSTGHFIVISSLEKVNGKISLGYYDNANATTGKDSGNKLNVNKNTGAMKDNTDIGVGGVQSYEVSEVRRNK